MSEQYALPGFDQPMSSISHLVGALLFVVLSVFLLRSAWKDRALFQHSLLFAFAVVFLLTMSGVYHMFPRDGIAGQVMIRLDVAAIFFLIASTFTPIHGLLFSGWKSSGVLIALWSIAVAGITLRTIFFDRVPILVGTSIFLAMGWLGVLSAVLLWQRYRWAGLVPTIAGGLMYTIGAVGDAFSWPTIIPGVWGSHEMFHLFVLAGIGFHWNLISNIVDGKLRAYPKKGLTLSGFKGSDPFWDRH